MEGIIETMKKKVLFLLEAFDKGGIEKVTLDIVNNLDPEKYDITVQTFWYGGHCQSLVNDNVKVIPFFFKRYVRGIIRLIEYLPPNWLYRLFVHGDYDVEIAASDGGAAKVIAGSNNKKAKKICWVHMDVVENGSRLNEYKKPETAKKIYDKFDKICCVSKPALEKFRIKFGDYDCVSVANNPLLSHEIKKKAEDKVVYKKDVCHVATAGRLVYVKGYDRLIQASADLVKEGVSEFQVHIIGDGILTDELKKKVQALDLQDVIIFEGFQSNPYPYVFYADWYICTSRDEAAPLTIGESFVLNTPVIGTDCAGVRFWLGDNNNGIVVDNSIEGIKEGLRTILSMPKEEYAIWKNKAIVKGKELEFHKQLGEWESEMELYNE